MHVLFKVTQMNDFARLWTKIDKCIHKIYLVSTLHELPMLSLYINQKNSFHFSNFPSIFFKRNSSSQRENG